jgi:uncharacterized membrane protein
VEQRSVKALIAPLRMRPRLMIAVAFGLAAAALLPNSLRGVTRVLVAWNITVWLYLALVGAMMRRPNQAVLRRHAAAHAEGAVIVLIIAVAAAAASVAAIVAELSSVKGSGPGIAWPNVLLALITLTGSWLLLPFEFALTYASRYFVAGAVPGGLDFPGADEHADDDTAPGYSDFLYFSLTIAATAQTSDVNITTPAMRRLVAFHALVSFAFNTMVLALAINIAASLL